MMIGANLRLDDNRLHGSISVQSSSITAGSPIAEMGIRLISAVR